MFNGAVLGLATTLVRGRQCRRLRGKLVLEAVRGRSAEERFGNIMLHGTAAAFVAKVRRSIRAEHEFNPTPIQDISMEPILQGKCITMQAPTGTGKTLAFMLPLWERFIERAQKEAIGPPILIVTPSEDLQQQIGIVGREVAGEAGDLASVVVLRRSMDLIEERLLNAKVIVGTPAQFLEMIGITFNVMCKVAMSLQTLVIDEADAMLPPGGARNDNLEEFFEFLSLNWEGKGPDGVARPRPAQIVACSASIDENSIGLLERALKCNFTRIRTGGRLTLTRSPTGRERLNGPPDDGEELWPPGLEHRAVLVPHVLDGQRRINMPVLKVIVQAIGSVSPQRCLVILAEGKGNAERGGSMGRYVRSLRQQLSQIGYTVSTVSAAISGPQAAFGIAGGIANMATETSMRQVILGRCEAIRGLDLVGVDLVVIVGEVQNAREYVHVTGRTARWEPGQTGYPSGLVLSIVDRPIYRRLRNWSKSLAFDLDLLHMKSRPEIFKYDGAFA